MSLGLKLPAISLVAASILKLRPLIWLRPRSLALFSLSSLAAKMRWFGRRCLRKRRQIRPLTLFSGFVSYQMVREAYDEPGATVIHSNEEDNSDARTAYAVLKYEIVNSKRSQGKRGLGGGNNVVRQPKLAKSNVFDLFGVGMRQTFSTPNVAKHLSLK